MNYSDILFGAALFFTIAAALYVTIRKEDEQNEW